MRLVSTTQYRYDTHADPDKVVRVVTNNDTTMQTVITDQALRDALAAADVLGVELLT